MLRLLALSAAVLIAAPASGELVRIAVIGDTQNGTSCVNATTAWDHLEAAFDYIVARGDIDFVMQTGDLVDQFTVDNSHDCYCMGIDPAPDACADIDHPVEGTGFCTNCADAEAIACAGGTAGLYCEWTRARALADKLETAGIPYMFVTGNHDYDYVPPLNSTGTWIAHDLYFGSGKVRTAGVLLDELVVSNVGVSVAPARVQLFSAGGTQWLVFGLPTAPWYRPLSTGATADKAEILAWMREWLDRYPRVLTMVLAHTMMSTDNGNGPTGLSCGLCQGQTSGLVGEWILDNLAEDYPQIFLLVSGHDRGMNHEVVTATAGHDILGVLVDTSYGADDVDVASWIYAPDPFPGDSPYPSSVDNGVLNGGGGIAHIITIDPVRDRIWMENYSEEAGERDDRTGQTGSRWTVNMPLCSDGVRFNWPAAACPDLEPSPRCCAK